MYMLNESEHLKKCKVSIDNFTIYSNARGVYTNKSIWRLRTLFGKSINQIDQLARRAINDLVFKMAASIGSVVVVSLYVYDST